MDDPFRPKSDQLVREAKIGLTIVALLVGLFCYVTWNRFNGSWDELPAHVRDAPVAKNMNEQFREDHRRQMADLDLRNRRNGIQANPNGPENFEIVRGQNPSRSLDPLTASSPDRNRVPSPDQSTLTVSKRTQDNGTPISFNGLRSQPSNHTADVETVGFDEETTAANSDSFDDPFGPEQPKSTNTLPEQLRANPGRTEPSAFPVQPRQLTPAEASEFKPQSKTNATFKGTDAPARPIPESSDFVPNRSNQSGDPQTLSTFSPGVFAQRTRFQVMVEDEPETDSITHPTTNTQASQNADFQPVGHQPSPNQFQARSLPTYDELSHATESLETPKRISIMETNTVPLTNQRDPQVGKLSHQPNEGQYIVQPTDASLWEVAERVYGDGRLFRAIYQLNQNRLPNPNRLEPGVTLAIPELDHLIAQYSDYIPSDLLPNPPNQDNVYVTQPGDSLFQVAGQQLGQASRFNELLELNRDVLPKNTTHLTPLPAGMKLALPMDIQ